MTKRISAMDVCMSDAMPFNQHWEARFIGTPDDLAEMLDSDTALVCGHRFAPGDLVHIVAFESKGWQRMTAVVDVRVVEVKTGASGMPVEVKIKPIGELVPVVAPVETKPDPDAGATDRFYVRPVGGGSFAVYDRNAKQGKSPGQAVDTFKDRGAAEQHANTLNGVKEAA